MRNKNKAVQVLAAALCLVLVLGMVPAYGAATGNADYSVSPPAGEVSIHTEQQAEYLALDYTAIQQGTPNKEEFTHPEPVVLSWTLEEAGVPQPEAYTVLLSEHEDLSDAREFSVTEPSLEVFNLKIDTQYYWNVTAAGEAGRLYVSDTFTFTTQADGPRNLYVDGVANVRDLGGWSTKDGGKVRQGLIYRCGRLNEDYAKTAQITQAGIDTMLTDLGIRSEIDLRMSDNNESGNMGRSVLGNEIRYFAVPILSRSGYNKLTDSSNEIKTLFYILANEDNYPLLFHCSIGTDRTGMFAYLLNGLLGVSEEDLERDFMFSNLAPIGGFRKVSRISEWKDAYDATEGDNLSQQIYNYLIGIGVKEENINAVIRILKEQP